MNKIEELINGKIATLSKCLWGADDDYILYGFEDEETGKKFWWLVEQDDLFGVYKDYDEFSKDYDGSEYDKCCFIVIKETDFERVEESQ